MSPGGYSYNYNKNNVIGKEHNYYYNRSNIKCGIINLISNVHGRELLIMAAVKLMVS